jgi:hypothetical protein
VISGTVATTSRVVWRGVAIGRQALEGLNERAGIGYAYDEGRLVLSGGLSTHKHVSKSELKSD